jgi:hypothetical protein
MLYHDPSRYGVAELQRERLSHASAEHRRRCAQRQERATVTAVGAVYVLVTSVTLLIAVQLIGVIANGKVPW